MQKYVRFQTELRCEETGRPLGVFAAAGRVEDSPATADHALELLRSVLHWFNRALIVPRIEERHWRSIFWFRADTTWLVTRIWDLVAILREEGVVVRKRWTTSPGTIVYADRYRVAAIPRRRRQN